MSKTYEIKTSKDGQQDIFTVEGDFIDDELDISPLRIYKFVDEEPVLVAKFNDWIYGIEKSVPEL